MQPLDKPLRNQLEKTVKKARDVAEEGARAALRQIGVGEKKKPDFLTEEQADLRRRLRAPTQWIFHGHPKDSERPLQVAVARLLGYRWPAEQDEDMELSAEARTWVARSGELNEFADTDGIVCLPAVQGQRKAVDRLRDLLAAAFGADWSAEKEEALLSDWGYKRGG